MRRFASENGISEDLIDYQEQILYRPESTPCDGEQVILPGRWAKYFDGAQDSGVYKLSIRRLSFGRPWYKENDRGSRRRLFYAQMVQHNVVGSRRSVFKDIE